MWFPNSIQWQIVRAMGNVKSLVAFFQERVKEHESTVDRQAEAPDYLFAYQQESETGARAKMQQTFNGENCFKT